MWRSLLRWLAPLLVVGSCCLPVEAQRGSKGSKGDDISRGVRDDEGPGIQTNPTAALPYAVAILSTIVVLVIVCSPTRKVVREE